MYQEKTLTCRDCGNEFIFSVSEQEFYEEKGFTNEPGRCRECRVARKQRNNGFRSQREMFPATCASCGVDTQVPFKPNGEKPVYCQDCYSRKRSHYSN